MISKGPLNTALNLAFIAGLLASAAVVVLFALPLSPQALVYSLVLFSCAVWALWGADFYASRGLKQKLDAELQELRERSDERDRAAREFIDMVRRDATRRDDQTAQNLTSLEERLRGVVGDRSSAWGAPTTFHGERVEERRHERAQDAGDDAELGALRTTERDENDDADQRREGERGDHDDAKKMG